MFGVKKTRIPILYDIDYVVIRLSLPIQYLRVTDGQKNVWTGRQQRQ